MTLNQYGRLATRKRCFYTNKLLVDFEDRTTDNKIDWRTIERIGSKKWYTKENCVSCCSIANATKSFPENPINNISLSQVNSIFSKVKSLVKK